MIEIATNTLGTTVTLVSPEIYDVNVDSSVTDRGEEQPAASQRPASGQPLTRSKEERSKEFPKKEKNNNNNNSADAGVVVVVPPSEVPEGDTSLETEAEDVIPAPVSETKVEARVEARTGALPPAPVGEMPNEDEDDSLTPSQKASKLAIELPKYLKCVCKLNQRPVFNTETLIEAAEWFKRNTDHYWYDIQAVCALAIKCVRETPAPDAGFDPYFWSRKYAHKVNSLFETNAQDDMILALIINEIKWAPDVAHDGDWATKLTADEVRLAYMTSQ